jgi:hypothetical protein
MLVVSGSSPCLLVPDLQTVLVKMRFVAPLALMATSAMAFQAPMPRARAGKVSVTLLSVRAVLGVTFKLSRTS